MARFSTRHIAHAHEKRVTEEQQASLQDLFASLKQGLDGHLAKIEAYLRNLATYPKAHHMQHAAPQATPQAATRVAPTPELGFLIELHSDRRDLFLNTPGATTKLDAGNIPMFTDMYMLLEEASHHLDWIALAMLPSTGNDLSNAAIIDCRNGAFATNCRKQGLQPTVHLGDIPVSDNRDSAEKHTLDRDSLPQNVLTLVHSGTLTGDSRMTLFQQTANALNLGKRRQAFTATMPTQMLYECLLPASTSHREPFTAADVHRLLLRRSDTNPESLASSLRCFKRKYYANVPGQS